MTEKFFCVCELDGCGCTDWISVETEESNGLTEDGDMLIEIDIWGSEKYLCHDCESPVIPILFSKVKKPTRKKIFKMKRDTRINWIKSWRIIDELENANEESYE